MECPCLSCDMDAVGIAIQRRSSLEVEEVTGEEDDGQVKPVIELENNLREYHDADQNLVETGPLLQYYPWSVYERFQYPESEEEEIMVVQRMLKLIESQPIGQEDMTSKSMGKGSVKLPEECLGKGSPAGGSPLAAPSVSYFPTMLGKEDRSPTVPTRTCTCRR